jgi:hypothetical protein
MPVKETSAERRAVQLRLIPLEKPWHAALLQVSAFPLAPHELPGVRSFVRLLSQALAGSDLSAEIFIQGTQLHVDEAGSRLSEHARQWAPQLGLGVWPGREPPTLWNKEDFEQLQIGAQPRPLAYQLFRITGSKRSRAEAREVMFGRGANLEILLDAPVETFLAKAEALLLPPIQESAFRSYPFYVPLLEAQSAMNAGPGQLDAWLCGAPVYVRESVEDRAVLILSRKPLLPVLQDMGGRSGPKDELHWEIPVEGYRTR